MIVTLCIYIYNNYYSHFNYQDSACMNKLTSVGAYIVQATKCKTADDEYRYHWCHDSSQDNEVQTTITILYWTYIICEQIEVLFWWRIHNYARRVKKITLAPYYKVLSIVLMLLVSKINCAYCLGFFLYHSSIFRYKELGIETINWPWKSHARAHAYYINVDLDPTCLMQCLFVSRWFCMVQHWQGRWEVYPRSQCERWCRV